MGDGFFLGLVNNAALLVALGLVVDLLPAREAPRRPWREALAGLVVGVMAVLVMATSVKLETGTVFDTRSVLLSLAALFLGPLPALLGGGIAAAYRWWGMGGGGAPMGVAVITVSVAIGLAWRRWRRGPATPTLGELLLFGLAVHAAMLGCTPLLPAGRELSTLRSIALPVMTIYPLAAVLLGQLLGLRQARRTADLVLAQREGRFRKMLEQGSDLVCLVDPDGRVAYSSDAVMRLLGEPLSSFTATAIPARVWPADLAAWAAALAATLAQPGVPIRAELRFRHHDGQAVWLEVTLTNRLGDADVGLIVLNGHGIGERKAAELALRDRVESIAALADHLPDIVARFDRELRHTYVNSAVSRATGLLPEVFVGKTNAEMGMPPALVAQWESALRQVFATGQAATLEFDFASHDGVQHFESRLVPEVGPDGGVATILCLNRDVTERRETLKRLAHLNQVLRAVRDINQLIVREQDAAALLPSVCRTLVEHRGCDAAQIVLAASAEFPALVAEAGAPEAVARIAAVMARAVAPQGPPGAVAGQGCWLLETPGPGTAALLGVALCHGGTAYGTLIVAQPAESARDPEGQALFAELAGDIAYALHGLAMRQVMARAERQRQDVEEQLRQAQRMESIGRLAGGVAHDFNNLLTVILGQVQLLELKLDDPQLRRRVEDIRGAGERAAGLTRQLLAFSRRQMLVVKTFQINDRLRELGDMLHRLIGEDIHLVLRLGDDVPTIRADPSQFDQVIINLAVNARDAMPTGGTLTITSQCVPRPARPPESSQGMSGQCVRIEVSDTGCGMDQAVLARLFEPFFTTKEQGRGTGLGLATVHGIVSQFGGHVEVTSAVGHGSTFTLWLPASEEPADCPAALHETNSGHGSGTVLVTEDEEPLRLLLAEVLRQAGFQVLVAADGMQALSVLETAGTPVDLLISDVVMPGLPGPQLAARAARLYPELRVLLISGYTERIDEPTEAARRAGRFLQKPFTPQQLLHQVRQVLAGPPGA
jgi:PAS domain S-box-containing protein